MKLSRIVINKFHRFKHVELDFERVTSINGKMVSLDGLTYLSEAIKFVLDCSEIPPQKLLYTITDSNDTVDDSSKTFVEADVIYLDDTQRKFTKSIEDTQIVFQIDGINVLQPQYRDELLSSGILTLPLNTLNFGPANVSKISTMSELKRAGFIEIFNGSEKVVKKYKHLSSFLQSTKIDLDSSLKNLLSLTTEKKRMKSKRESAEKRALLVQELEMKSKELELFSLYHNNKFIDSAFDGASIHESRLVELKDSLTTNFQAIKEQAGAEGTLNYQKILAVTRLEQAFEQVLALQRYLSRKKASTKSLKLDLQVTLRSSEAETEGVRQEIEKLTSFGESSANLEKNQIEFQQLQVSFDANNEMEEFEALNMSRISLNDMFERLKSSINIHQDSAKQIAKEISSIEQEIKEVSQKRHVKCQERESIETKQKEVEQLAKGLKFLQNASMNNNENFLNKYRQNVIVNLKKKFAERVVGRISELYKPAAGASQKFIRDLLGKFSEAIVVDTVETAEECVEHLKLKQLYVDEIFLPLNELVNKQKMSKAFLPHGELPLTVDCVFIENLVETLKEHEKVLLFCLKPSLVVQTLNEAEMLMKLQESKKLDIASVDSATCFRKQGFMNVNGDDNEPGDREDNILVTETKLMKLKAELVQLNPHHSLLNREILLLDAQIARLVQSIEPHRKLYCFHTKEVETLRAEYNKILTQLDVRKTNLYHELKSEMDIKKLKHFGQFCEKIDVASIEDYLKIREYSQKLVELHIEILRQGISTRNEDKAFIQDLIEQMTFEDDSFEIIQLEQNLEMEKQHLTEAVDDLCSNIEKYFGLTKDVKQKEGISDELIIQINDIYEQIYDNLSNVQMSLKENFEILMDNFISHSSLSLTAGNIGNFIVPPDNVPLNFHLVSEQLKTIEVNFDHLKSSLKNVTDMTVKTHDLMKNLDKLKEDIEKSSGKVTETVSDQRFKRVIEELKEATKTYESFRQKMAELNEKMDEVKEERKRIFEECLKALNEGISEFCKFAFGQQIVANLEAANEVEPYLGEIAYFWRTLENVDNRISEFQPNPVAALALLFAVLKWKKQSFVILDDVLKDVGSIDSIERFMQQQNHLQIVLLTSQIADESSNYIIRQKSQAFVVTRFN